MPRGQNSIGPEGQYSRGSDNNLAKTSHVRARIEQASSAVPADRWANLARSLDRRLVDQRDWPATAAIFQQIYEAGHEVPALASQLVTHTPLGHSPAQDLRYLFVGYLPDNGGPVPASMSEPRQRGVEQQCRAPNSSSRRSEIGHSF